MGLSCRSVHCYPVFLLDPQDPVQDGIPCLWFPAPKAATVILFFHANAEPWGHNDRGFKGLRGGEFTPQVGLVWLVRC